MSYVCDNMKISDTNLISIYKYTVFLITEKYFFNQRHGYTVKSELLILVKGIIFLFI